MLAAPRAAGKTPKKDTEADSIRLLVAIVILRSLHLRDSTLLAKHQAKRRHKAISPLPLGNLGTDPWLRKLQKYSQLILHLR